MKSDSIRFPIVAFLCGFNVMLTEMCAFRVLQTHFGSSVFITGILLTIVLLSMTWGSYLGGAWRVLRSESIPVLALAAAAIYLVVVDLIFRDSIVEVLSVWKVGYVRFGFPALTSVVLYFFPILIVSALLPLFVHGSASVPGTLVGKLISMSNLGSIVGVLLTTFVLLPYIGLKQTTVISVLTLLVCSWALCRRPMYGKLAVISVSVVGLILFSYYRREVLPPGVVQRGQSLYGEYTVRINKVDGVAKSVSYSPSRVYTHSAFRYLGLSRNRLELDALSYGFLSPQRQFLMLGSGAGGVLRVLAEMPSTRSNIVGVEIDPAAIRVARDWFGVTEGPTVQMVAEDARAFLVACPESKYDYVIIDLFAGESLPVHCLTVEFFRLLHSRLSERGVFFFNTNLPQQGPLGLPDSNYNALAHVVASIRHAGFRSVFVNDQHERGFLYVFKEDLGLEELLGRLREFVADTTQPSPVRLAILANYFTIQPVPERWTQFSIYTDDLVPEHRIYSYFLADWRSRAVAAEPMPGESMAPLRSALVRYAKAEPSDEANRQYAQAILGWMDAKPDETVRRVLAATMCWNVSTELLAARTEQDGPATRRLLSYLRAVNRETPEAEAIELFYQAM